MKKILIIQSRLREDILAAEQAEYVRSVAGKAETHFAVSLDESLPWHDPAALLAGFDGVIFGGSGDFDFDGGRSLDDPARLTSQAITARVRPLVTYAILHDFPLLGICYGHQIVAEAHDVRVVNDHEQKKVGTYQVTLTKEGEEDVLFSQLPQTFLAQYGHKDSLSAVPPGGVLLASSTQCKTSVVRFNHKVYTMQFHPELRRDDMMRKLRNSPGYLPEGINLEDIMKESPEASQIIPLFLNLVVEV